MSAYEQKQPFNPPPTVWNHQRLEERRLLKAYLEPVANGKLVNVGKLSHMGRFQKFNRPGCQFKASLLQLTTPWISHAKSIKLETCCILKKKNVLTRRVIMKSLCEEVFSFFFSHKIKKAKGRDRLDTCVSDVQKTRLLGSLGSGAAAALSFALLN